MTQLSYRGCHCRFYMSKHCVVCETRHNRPTEEKNEFCVLIPKSLNAYDNKIICTVRRERETLLFPLHCDSDVITRIYDTKLKIQLS